MAAYLKKPFTYNPLIARKPLIRVTYHESGSYALCRFVLERDGSAIARAEWTRPFYSDEGKAAYEATHWRRFHGDSQLGQSPGYLKLLGLTAPFAKADVIRAFRKAARQHHPDKGGDPDQFRARTSPFGWLPRNPQGRRLILSSIPEAIMNITPYRQTFDLTDSSDQPDIDFDPAYYDQQDTPRYHMRYLPRETILAMDDVEALAHLRDEYLLIAADITGDLEAGDYMPAPDPDWGDRARRTRRGFCHAARNCERCTDRAWRR
jgi:hypothetical protein